MIMNPSEDVIAVKAMGVCYAGIPQWHMLPDGRVQLIGFKLVIDIIQDEPKLMQAPKET